MEQDPVKIIERGAEELRKDVDEYVGAEKNG